MGTSSWREQFADAIKVNADDDDDDDDEKSGGGGDDGNEKADGGEDKDKKKENEGKKEEKEEKHPSVSDYLIHFISLFWKILFAFVPPTGTWIISTSKKTYFLFIFFLFF